MKWKREAFLIPIEGTLKLVPSDLFSIYCETPGFATLVTFFDVVTHFLDVVL